jgi:hypothetical protein
MDENGRWYAYTQQPVVGTAQWIVDSDYTPLLKSVDTSIVADNWKESCIDLDAIEETPPSTDPA